MADISASMVKDLRERTGAGMIDCKKALEEVRGDMDKAVEYLRKKGLAAAAKKAGRVAAEGLVTSYIHGGGRVGVLLEVNCETDFVAKNESFQQFCKDVTLQIAAMSPRWVSKDEVPAEMVAKEREIRADQARQSGKPAQVIEKIVEGQIAKWLKEVCLLEQTFVKDPEGKKDIQSLLTDLVAKVDENCRVRRFVRFELGEGLEKKKDDFVDEVKKQAGL